MPTHAALVYTDYQLGQQVQGYSPGAHLVISQETFVHEPSTDAAVASADLRGLANQQAVATVLERFVNEDAGKFYGRTEALVAELAELAGGRA